MKMILMAAALSVLSSAAHAEGSQTNTNRVKAAHVVPADVDTAAQEEIDKEITNAKLRAEMGSKSRWSIKTAFSYYGGSVERPLADVRPNYRSGAQVPELASIQGTIGVKYALGLRDSLSLSTGVSILTPFSGAVDRQDLEDPRGANEQLNRYEVSTPSLSYSHASKQGDLQLISTATYSHATDSDSVNGMGQLGYVSLMQTVVTEFGTSGWSGGALVALYKYIYRGDQSAEFIAQGSKQIDFVYGIYPVAEYAFNDTYSFRTVFGYFDNISYRGSNTPGAVQSRPPYQSVGIGISVARDIYFYPAVQFTPLDIRSDRTNIAVSANINVF